MHILRTATATLASASLLLAPVAASAQVPVRPSLPEQEEKEKLDEKKDEKDEKKVDEKAREEFRRIEREKSRLFDNKEGEGSRADKGRLTPGAVLQRQLQPAQATQPARPTPPTPTPTPPPSTPRPQAPAAPRTQAPAAPQAQQQGAARTPEQQQMREEARRRGRFQLDFDKADIADVVQTISDFTGKLFILPENMRGKITIVGPEDGTGLVTAEEAYAAFLSALEANNWTVYPVGQYLKLVEKRSAANSNVWTYTESDAAVPADERVVTKIIRLRYINTDALANPLKQLASKDAQIIPFPPDTLIITEVALNLRRLERIIQSLDRPGGGDELRVIQVEYAGAQELADKLLQVFETQSGGGGGAQQGRPRPPAARGKENEAGGDESVSVTRVIADERTNKLIVIASSRAFEQINELIRHLDVPTGDTGRINVYYLENADAEELANTLQSLTSGTGGGGAATPARGGTAAGRRTQAQSPTGGAAELFAGEVKISADKATNSLVVVASAQDYKSLVRVIEQLDIRRNQVFVEAVIMEVNLNNTDEYGISFHGGHTIDTDDGIVPIVAGSQLGSAKSLNLSSLLSMGGFMAGIQGPNVPGAAELGVALPSFGVVMHALTRSSDVNVLSTPHILTSDNEEAEITVGQNVPFQAGYAPSGLASLLSGTNANATGSLLGTAALTGGLSSFYAPIQRQNVELKLKIKPQINESDYVRMQIEEQTEEIAQQDPQLGPTTAKRTAKTVVVAKDQTTVVIGGLIQDRTINSVQKTPILGDIPVIGRLFRDTSTQRIKTNLLLFLTPYIIRDQADFRRIFERKMKEREEFIAAFYGIAEDYEVPVDYARKAGPLALLNRDVAQELQRLENGGPGIQGERAIRPRQELQVVPRGSVPPGEELPAEESETIPAPAAGEPFAAPEPPEAAAGEEGAATDEDAEEEEARFPAEPPPGPGPVTPAPQEGGE